MTWNQSTPIGSMVAGSVDNKQDTNRSRNWYPACCMAGDEPQVDHRVKDDAVT